MKFQVVATVIGNVYLGEVEAENFEAAEEKANAKIPDAFDASSITAIECTGLIVQPAEKIE